MFLVIYLVLELELDESSIWCNFPPTEHFQLTWSSCTQSDQPSSTGKFYHMEVTFQLPISQRDQTSRPGEQWPGRGGDQHCWHLQDRVHHPDAVDGSETLQDWDFQGVSRLTHLPWNYKNHQIFHRLYPHWITWITSDDSNWWPNR